MPDSNSKSIIIGLVGHISPEYLADFKRYLENFRYFVKKTGFTETDALLTIVEKIELFEKELEKRNRVESRNDRTFSR